MIFHQSQTQVTIPHLEIVNLEIEKEKEFNFLFCRIVINEQLNCGIYIL